MTSKLRFLIVVLLVLGIFFRFGNIERKFYWYDETFTSLRISGYTQAEVVQQIAKGQVIDIEDLQKYQRPNSEKSLIDTVKGLAIEEPQLTPLYFVIARFWVLLFGNSVTVTRSLSAIFSLLAFPCIYWLCLELFPSSLTGWVAIALFAVSPFHVLYAQEARPYSLWTVTILLGNAALLRAMRLKTKLSWGIYAATVIFGLYSHLLSALVVIAHGIYVVATEKLRWSKTVISFAIASGAALLAFAPWVLVVITNSRAAAGSTNWSKIEINLLSLVKNWAANISRIFFDFGLTSDSPSLYLISTIPILLILLTLVGYAIYFLCRHTPQQVWLFILTSIGVTALFIALPDLFLGGIRSTKSRYLIPAYLGIQLAVAYLIATKINLNYVKLREQKLWQIITIAIFTSGILSCAISSQANTWWNKESGDYNPKVARIIDRATRPLVISNFSADGLNQVIPLSYLLEGKVQFQLTLKENVPNIANGFSDVFLYNPTEGFLEKIKYKNNYNTEPAYKSGKKKVILWKLVKK